MSDSENGQVLGILTRQIENQGEAIERLEKKLDEHNTNSTIKLHKVEVQVTKLEMALLYSGKPNPNRDEIHKEIAKQKSKESMKATGWTTLIVAILMGIVEFIKAFKNSIIN